MQQLQTQLAEAASRLSRAKAKRESFQAKTSAAELHLKDLQRALKESDKKVQQLQTELAEAASSLSREKLRTATQRLSPTRC